MNDLLDDKKPDASYFNQLVGDDKKFKTQEDLARGKYEADQFIEVMKGRMDELRSDYLKLREESVNRASVEDLINQYRTKTELTSNDLPAVKEVREPAFDPKKVEDLVFSKVQEIERSKKEEDNFNQVRSKLKEKYGDKSSEVLKQRIDDLSLTPEFANELARKHPTAFMKTFGLDEQSRSNFQNLPRGEVRSDNFKPVTAEKTWNYYQDMRKSDPKQYYSKRIQNEMHNMAIEMGDRFNDGDFNVSDKDLLRRLDG